MTNYTVNTLELGEFITESGETIDHLRLRYEHVGLPGQPLVVVCHALTGNHLTYGTMRNLAGGEKSLMVATFQFMIINFLHSMSLEVHLVRVLN